MAEIVNLLIDEIQVGERIRQPEDSTITSLMESIREIGLLHPITVGRVGGAIHLIAGLSRLQAYKRLGIYSRIPCIIVDVDAKLAEIDENLIRGKLSPAEESIAWFLRKTLYEAEHPETKHGAAPGKAGGGKRKRESAQNEHSGSAERHSQAAAKATGKGESTIRRYSKCGKDLLEHDMNEVVGTALDSQPELDALTKLAAEAPEAAKSLVKRAAQGEKVSARTALRKLKRESNERSLSEKIVALPDKKYGVILADPEWRFEPWSRETGLDRAADNHYSTSGTQVIASRDVPSIAAKDCVLFLWATVPMLPQALAVMGAWGFDYRSNFVWVKDRIGTGYWNRNAHELLLIGVRGNVPAPAPGTQWNSAIDAPVGRHSEKPETFLDLIEVYFPTLPKIELNRRGPPRPGWDAWGNEAQEEDAA